MQLPTSLTVLVALPLAAAMQEAEAVFWRNVGWTTAIFLLAAFVAVMGSHLTVVRPIRELQKFADALSRGDFQSRPPTDRGGAKELRALGMHFDAMRRSLEQRQAQLVEALQQKDVLLKEVNHRVKNSLQLVASLIGLQRASIKDPEARRQFEQAGRRINTVAQIHQRLYQDEHVDQVALDRFLKDLCADLQGVMGRDGTISFVCEATACQLPTEQVIPVALIVNELATNAVKYGYPGDIGGVIRVVCEQDSDCVTVTVSDDGAPLPDNFAPSESTGLGMKMITALARQLRATLDVVRRLDGKSFVLRVPVREDRRAS
jgi:two-component sensor histidine kinase